MDWACGAVSVAVLMDWACGAVNVAVLMDWACGAVSVTVAVDWFPCAADEDAGIPAEGVERDPAEERSSVPPSASCPLITMTAPTPEKSTDHKEQHLASPAAATTAVANTATNGAAPLTRRVEQGQARAATSAPVSVGPATPVALPAEQTAYRRDSSSSSKEKTATTTTTSGASKVETGSPTLLSQTAVSSDSGSAPQAERRARPSETETPTQPIPGRPGGGPETAASAPAPASLVHNYSPTQSVMECTKPAVDTDAGGPQGGTPPTRASPPATRASPPPGEASPPATEASSASSPAASAGAGVDTTGEGQPPKAARSPVSRQKYLRRQKEERDKRKERAASPHTPHTGDSGKPPLPRQSTPHQSPSAAQRSKSVGDMDGIQPDSAQAVAPLRDVIQKFEKRATVCETEERKIEFRKTPSPTLHLPRVGLVSRVRRLKPAAELLQESQRYRSGHSIYATRIMQRYLPAKVAQQSGGPSPTPLPLCGRDKENVSGQGHVQAMVSRLSREGTPVKSAGSSGNSSSLSLHRTQSPGRTQSELVSHLIHRLSASSAEPELAAGPEPPSAPSAARWPGSTGSPLKDLTNEGRVRTLSHTFSAEVAAQGPSGRDQTLSAPDLTAPGRTEAAGEATLQPGSVPGQVVSPEEGEAERAASHVSMPALATDQPEVSGDASRERAASYCVSEGDRPRQQQRDEHGVDGESMEHIAEEFLDPALLSIREARGQKISPSSSTKSKNALCCQSSACTKTKSSSSSSHSAPHTSGAQQVPSSPKRQERRAGRGTAGGTIGVLCKQSLSFDLGVSLRAQSPEVTPRRPQSAESLGPDPGAGAEGGDNVKLRPSSTSSEGEVTSAGSDDKKKARTRFLDSSWFQKPKKFFKVSK